MLHTTMHLLKQAKACKGGYTKLAHHLGVGWDKNQPIPLTKVLDSNGLADALWCLRAVLPAETVNRDKLSRLLAGDYAEHVLPLWEDKYPNDKRPRQAIEAARQYAAGHLTNLALAAAEAVAEARAAEHEWQAQKFREYLASPQAR